MGYLTPGGEDIQGGGQAVQGGKINCYTGNKVSF